MNNDIDFVEVTEVGTIRSGDKVSVTIATTKETLEKCKYWHLDIKLKDFTAKKNQRAKNELDSLLLSANKINVKLGLKHDSRSYVGEIFTQDNNTKSSIEWIDVATTLHTRGFGVGGDENGKGLAITLNPQQEQ